MAGVADGPLDVLGGQLGVDDVADGPRRFGDRDRAEPGAVGIRDVPVAEHQALGHAEPPHPPCCGDREVHVLRQDVREVVIEERGLVREDAGLLGWADGHLYEHLVGVVGATEEEALATGLFVRFRDGRVTDFFQQRLVFPYWRRGRVVYFIARQTELTPEAPWEQAKYKKLLTRSDKHPYVSTLVQNDTFYNEDAATRSRVRQLLVTEGVTDCISAMQVGVPCISPVTVRFRKKDLPKLIALTERVSEVVICNDSEDSGAGEAGATETAAALQAEGRIVRIARIPRPEGKDKVDLNELVAEGGAAALERVMRDAADWCEHLIEQIPADASKREVSTRLREVLPLIRSADPVLRDGGASRAGWTSSATPSTSTSPASARAPRPTSSGGADGRLRSAPAAACRRRPRM